LSAFTHSFGMNSLWAAFSSFFQALTRMNMHISRNRHLKSIDAHTMRR
jgi:hypothetical protein